MQWGTVSQLMHSGSQVQQDGKLVGWVEDFFMIGATYAVFMAIGNAYG
jgi:hypothetical protein